MGEYSIEIKETARKDLAQIKKSGNKADIKKIERIFAELEENPFSGTGRPEQLKYELSGYWSRRINKKDRLIYRVDGMHLIVIVVSAKGHYFD